MPILAFPTATGAGAYTTGGRGGVVLHVTTLNWDNNEGSLKWALQQPYPRVIVFDVSGTIKITATAYQLDGQQYSNLTIAGQTAPEGGITIEHSLFAFKRMSNVILRHIRFVHVGYFHPDGPINGTCLNFDVLGLGIVDHISTRYSWFSVGFGSRIRTGDGGETIGITVQRSIFGESKTGMLVGNDAIDPVEIGFSGDFSIHHNLFAHISHRFPNMSGNGNFEVINNVVHNPFARLSTVFNNAKANLIGNYYRKGPNITTPHNKIATYINIPSPPQMKVYTEGNINETTNYSSTDTSWDGLFVTWADNSGGQANPPNEAAHRSLSKFTDISVPVTIQDADDAYVDVLANVGVDKYLNADGTYGIYLDTVDQSYIDDTINGTCSGCNGTAYRSLTDINALVYPVLPINTRPSSYYNEAKSADIPEVWFDANVPNGQTSTDLAPSGYMWIEEFANQVDGEIVVVNIPQITRTDNNPTTIVQGGTYTPPTGIWTDVEDGTGAATVGGATVDVNTIGTYNVTLFHTDTDGNTGSLTIVYTVVAPPQNNNGKPRKKVKFIKISN